MESEEGIVEIPDDDFDEEDIEEEEEYEEGDGTKVTEEDMFKKQSPQLAGAVAANSVMAAAPGAPGRRVLEPGEVIDGDDVDEDDDDDDDEDEDDDTSDEDDDEDEEDDADSDEDMAGSADSSMASEKEENSNASSSAVAGGAGDSSVKKAVIKLPPLPAGLTVSAVQRSNTESPGSAPEEPVKKRRKRATKAEMAERRAKAEAEAREKALRGETPGKRRGRKPRPPEEKARIAEEKRMAKQAEKVT